MNYRIVRHLILKDVRHQRTRLILIWLMAYLLPLTNLLPMTDLSDVVGVAKAGIILLMGLLIILTWVSAILLDPTCGSNRFLKTRPVEWTTLLASKSLFVLIFLWIPMVIFRLGVVLTASVHMSFVDQALYLFESTLLLSAVASLFVLPALFFQRLTTVIITLVGFAIFFYVGYLILPVIGNLLNAMVGFTPVLESPQTLDLVRNYSLTISSYFVICAILVFTLMAVGIIRYWKPLSGVPPTLIFAGFFLALVYGSTWSIPLDQFLSDAPVPPKKPGPPLRDQIHFTLQSSAWDISRKWANVDAKEAERRLEFHLNQKIHVDGINRPLALFWTGESDEVLLRSGKKFGSGNSGVRVGNPLWFEDYLRQACTGISPTDPNYENSDITEQHAWFGEANSTNALGISEAELPGAVFRGSLNFEVVRFKILKIVPLKEGSRFDSTRQCYQIRKVMQAGRDVRYLLNRSFVRIALRGDFERWPNQDERYSPYIIMNRKTGEILDDSQSEDYFNPLDGLYLQWRILSRGFPDKINRLKLGPPIPREWLDDLDVCFFDYDDLGGISFPFSTTVNDVIK